MMHYQAVASPAGVINDVTHHTILPPLLSITSALLKCTTNFWHNATYVHQHRTNTSLHMILQLHMIFYLLVVLVLLCNLLHLFLVTNDHSHTPQMFLPRVHAPQKNQAGTWRSFWIAANLAHPFLILLRMCSQHCILLTTNWSHFLDKHTFTFWCWHKQGWMSVNGETLLTLERVND